MSDTFFGDLLASIADRGRSFLRLRRGTEKAESEGDLARPVSYTHLTLPTILLV